MEAKELTRLLTVNPAVIYVIEKKAGRYRLTWISRNVTRLLGYSPVKARTEDWWANRIHPDDRDRVLHEMGNLEAKKEQVIHYRFKAKNGDYRYLQDTARLKHYPDSGLTQIIGSWLDITEKKSTEQKVDRLHRAYAMLSQTNESIIRYRDERELYQKICNIAVEEGGFKLAWVGLVDPNTLQVDPVAQAGRDGGYIAQVCASVDKKTAYGRGPVGSAIREGRIFICKDVENDKHFKPWREPALKRGFHSVVAFPLNVNGNIIGSIALYIDRPNYFDDEELGLLAEMANDLSFGLEVIRAEQARHNAEQEIEKLAYYDTLTGLPNMERYKQILETMIETTENSKKVGVIVFGISRFSEINHALGYEQGNQVLKSVSERVKKTLWERAELSRLGGGKFSLCLPNIAALDQAFLYGKHLLNTFKEPVKLSGLPIELDISIGIAISPDHGNDPITLIQRADRACKISKEHWGNTIIAYKSELDVEPSRLQIISEIRQAINQAEFVLYYQPKIDIKRSCAVSVESLIRWQHPERGMVPPNEFIPMAEKFGLITDITLYVLEMALKQCLAWRDKGIHLQISINVSAQDIHKEGFCHSVIDLLTTYGLDPRLLILELTESTIMSNPEQSIETLRSLHDMGVKFAIDDFGTGYSSLSYLAKLPLDQLKIDGSFVMRMKENKSDLSIVRSTIDLAHDLDLEVVAEGIEDDTSMEILKELGCDKGQGYGISPPITADSINTWLEKSSFPVRQASR